MNKLLNFGLYKGKQYEYVIKNDINYCNYILTLTKNTIQPIKDFQKFIKENTDTENVLRN